MYAYVVTNPELGWDCVVDVFDASTTTENGIKDYYREDDCSEDFIESLVIHFKKLTVIKK